MERKSKVNQSMGSSGNLSAVKSNNNPSAAAQKILDQLEADVKLSNRSDVKSSQSSHLDKKQKT